LKAPLQLHWESSDRSLRVESSSSSQTWRTHEYGNLHVHKKSLLFYTHQPKYVEELTRFLLDQKYVKGLTLYKHILWFPFGAKEWDWLDGASGGLLCLDAPFSLALKVRGPRPLTQISAVLNSSHCSVHRKIYWELQGDFFVWMHTFPWH